jgi:hypothetical protein
MRFEHESLAFNLIDTPGRRDFSEDTLPHADRGRQCGGGARRRKDTDFANTGITSSLK